MLKLEVVHVGASMKSRLMNGPLRKSKTKAKTETRAAQGLCSGPGAAQGQRLQGSARCSIKGNGHQCVQILRRVEGERTGEPHPTRSSQQSTAKPGLPFLQFVAVATACAASDSKWLESSCGAFAEQLCYKTTSGNARHSE